ncbi:MAG: hypothetical protein M9907_11990 [Burkholderiaceae bacterium]|nr:hypothetical protein [Burkholderiaceae bacterium]
MNTTNTAPPIETPAERKARVSQAIREGQARAARMRKSTAAGKAVSAGMARAKAARAAKAQRAEERAGLASLQTEGTLLEGDGDDGR